MAKKPPVDTTRLNPITQDQIQALRLQRAQESAELAALEPRSEAGDFVGAGFLGGSQYDQTLIRGTDQERARAVQQGGWDEFGNMWGRIAYNLIPGVAGSVAAILDPEDYLAGLTQQDEVGNAVTRWANEQKQKTNQERFPIYKQDPGKVLDIGSTEWWTDNGSSVLGSAAEFAILGFGIGGVLKGAMASKWLKALTTITDTATGVSRLNKGAELTAIGTNAFLLNHAEGMLEATQVYGSELEKNMQLVDQGLLTEEQAKVNAGAAASHTLNINRANVFLNLSGVSSIMKGARGSRNLVRSLTTPQKLILEGGQEYLEESINFYASNRGEEYGQALREGKGDEYRGATLERFVEDITSAKGVEAGFLGALGGVAQTGFIAGINKIKGGQDVEKAYEAEQKAIRTGYEDLRNENKLKSVRDLGIATQTISHLVAQRSNLEADIQKAKAEGVPVSNAKIAEWQKVNDSIQDEQLHASFQSGTAEYTEKAYKDIENLTIEEAAQNGFTGSELDEKSPAFYKHTARRMQERLTKLEAEYNKTAGYNNAYELYVNRATALRTKDQLKSFAKQEGVLVNEAQEAIDRLGREGKAKSAKDIGTIDITQLFEPSYEKLEGALAAGEDVTEFRRDFIAAAKKLPEVQDLANIRETITKAQTELDRLEKEFKEQTKFSYQNKIRKEKEAEIAEEKAKIEEDKLDAKAVTQQAEKLAADTKVANEKNKDAHDQTLRQKGLTEEEVAGIRTIADREANTPVGQEIAYTPQEEALMAKYPQDLATYRDIVQASVAKDNDLGKANELVFTSSDNDYTEDALTNLGKIGLDAAHTTLVNKQDGEVAKPLHRANNVMAWLSRGYQSIRHPETWLKIISDIDNKINDELKDPTVLDARTLKIGDNVILRVDPNGVVPVKDRPGAEYYEPWADFLEQNNDSPATLAANAPIGIYRVGEDVPVGYVHLPDWIRGRVGDNLAYEASEIQKVIDIRNAVQHAGPAGIKTKIVQRTLGKLFLDMNKQAAPVSTNLKDPDLEYAVYYKHRLLASDTSTVDTNKIVLNREKLKSGITYVLLPVEKNVKPELTKYWAVPLKIEKIPENVVNSIVRATEVFLRSLKGAAALTAEDNAIAEAIIKMQRDVTTGASTRVNFDIRTEPGIINYTELFIYNHTAHGKTKLEKDAEGKAIKTKDLDFDKYFVQRYKSLPTDYFAHKFNRKKGLQYGSGKGVVTKVEDDAQSMQAWKEHLLNRYQHTALRYLHDKQVKLPIINPDNSVVELASGETYLNYLKQHAWSTNVIGQNIAKPTQPDNWVYTIQQIIEFDTSMMGVANEITTEADRQKAARAREKAEREKAEAKQKKEKPATGRLELLQEERRKDAEFIRTATATSVLISRFPVTIDWTIAGRDQLNKLKADAIAFITDRFEKAVEALNGEAIAAEVTAFAKRVIAATKAGQRLDSPEDIAFYTDYHKSIEKEVIRLTAEETVGAPSPAAAAIEQRKKQSLASVRKSGDKKLPWIADYITPAGEVGMPITGKTKKAVIADINELYTEALEDIKEKEVKVKPVIVTPEAASTEDPRFQILQVNDPATDEDAPAIGIIHSPANKFGIKGQGRLNFIWFDTLDAAKDYVLQAAAIEARRNAELANLNKLKVQDMKTKVANMAGTLDETWQNLIDEIDEFTAGEEFENKPDRAVLKAMIEGLFTIPNSNPLLEDDYNPAQLEAFMVYTFPDIPMPELKRIVKKHDRFFEHAFVWHKMAVLAAEEGQSGLPENMAELTAAQINAKYNAELEALKPVPTRLPTNEELEERNNQNLGATTDDDFADDFFPNLSGAKSLKTAVTGNIVITAEQTAENIKEEAETTEKLKQDLLKSETAYQAISSKYALPKSEHFDNVILADLLEFWSNSIFNDYTIATENAAKAGKEEKVIIQELLNNLKAKQQANLSAPITTNKYKVAAYAVANWEIMENLIKHKLQREFEFSFRKYNFNQKDQDEINRLKSLEDGERNPDQPINPDESRSLKDKDGWMMDSMERDPAAGLSSKFRRFLGGILDTSRFYLTQPTKHPNFKPVRLYRTLSALLQGMDADFNQMMDVMLKASQRPGLAYLADVRKALLNADEQIQGEFVSTMSKHYVYMKHLYIISRWAGGEKYYQGLTKDDNYNAKVEVIKSRWEHDLYLSAIAKEYAGDDRREGRQVYNKAGIDHAIEIFEKQLLTIEGTRPEGKLTSNVHYTEFDIDYWLGLVGITSSPGSIADLRTNGTRPHPNPDKNMLKYRDMFYADDGEFWNLYQFLKGIQAEPEDIFIEDKTLTRESFAYRLAYHDTKYNVDAFSHSHNSGNKSIFSYADNKYVFDRARKLGGVLGDPKPDIALLDKLAKSPFVGKHSQELKQILEYDKDTGEFIIDPATGMVKYNTESEFNKNFKVSYASLSLLIQKGIPTGNKNSLEDLDPREHMIAKMMLFQNQAIGPAVGERRGNLFHMTLAEKNTMLLFEKPIPGIDLDPYGQKIGKGTIDMLYDNIVMAEISRMQAFDKAFPPNFKDYDKGQRLFYMFPRLNLVDKLFNIQYDETGREVARSLKKDVTTNPSSRELINNVIRDTIAKEVAFTMQTWEELGLLRRSPEGVITELDYLDGQYTAWVKNQLPPTETTTPVGAVAHYAATEMAVAYMLHDMNLFQLFTTDPATQYKYKAPEINPLTGEKYSEDEKPPVDVMDEVHQTFENITKRLGGEISPGRDGFIQYTGPDYGLSVMEDIVFPSKAIAEYEKLFKDDPEAVAAFRKLVSTDGAEIITLPEKLRFMREHAKLNPDQLAALPRIEKKYNQRLAAIRAGKTGEEVSKYNLDYEELTLIFQVDKPIMVGTRYDQNVESKIFVKSAAFTLIPELIQGSELEKLMLYMSNPANPIDRMATVSSFKLGAPVKALRLFNAKGDFIPGVPLDPSDVLKIPRQYLRLQQETPYKETTEIARVSQASKQAFVNILDVKGFRLPGEEKPYTGRELAAVYNKHYEFLYKDSYNQLVKKLGIKTDENGKVTLDHKKLNNLIQDELVSRGYPVHDLDALEITRFPKEETDKNGRVIPLPEGVESQWRFKMPIWAAAQSGKLEAFLNSIITNRILKQKFNGYGFVLGPEGGYKFKPSEELVDAEGKKLTKGILTDLSQLGKKLHSQIVFTDKFDPAIGLKPALINNGFHQVILPWKFKQNLARYIVNGKLDSTKFDPDLLKLFGMRIPNQGPNSTAALEVVGFFPPSAGDLMIAPAEFTAQMGSDFDIDKLYTYMYHYKEDDNGKLTRVDAGQKATDRESHQNKILDIHLAINTNPDPVVRQLISQPLTVKLLDDIANRYDAAKKARSIAEAQAGGKISPYDLAPASGSYQSFKYQGAVVAETAVGAFAVQNTFNALAQSVEGGLRMVKTWGEKPGEPNVYVKIKFGRDTDPDQEVFDGNLSKPKTKSGAYVSTNLAMLLSGAVDFLKNPALARIGVNLQNISLVNFMGQAQFELDTISNFINQDILQEYTRQLAVTNGNERKAFAIVMSQPQFAFDDELFKNAGEEKKVDPDKAVGAKPAIEPEETADEEIDPFAEEPEEYTHSFDARNPIKDRFWNFYNMSSKELFNLIALGAKDPHYKEAQYVLLLKFQHMNKRAKKLRQLVGLSNIDSKGMGANMFQSLLQQEDIEALGDPRALGIENAAKIFGDFKLAENYVGKDAAIEALLEQGYVKGDKFYLKPTSIPGFAYAYGVITNNKIWQDHFPYSKPEVYQAVKNVSDKMRNTASNVFSKAEQYRKIFREFKSYVFTDNLVSPINPRSGRKLLLVDYTEVDAQGNKTEHLSLATIMRHVEHNPLTAKLFREDVFLRNLYVRVNPDKRMPQPIMFRQPTDDETTNRDIYNAVYNLIKYPVEFGEFNGIKYTSRTFVEHLLQASNVSATNALQFNLMQYMPTELLVQEGFADRLHAYDWSRLYQNATGEPTRVEIQYFQTQPTLAPELNLLKHTDLDFTIYGHDQISEAEEEQELTIEDVQAAAAGRPENILKFSLKPEFDPETIPSFWYHKVGTKIMLFQLTNKELMQYSRISTLLNSATSNSHEYNANVGQATSMIPENNPHAFTVPEAFVGRQNLPPKQKGRFNQSYTVGREENVQKILASYGLHKGEYVLTTAQVDKMLETMFVNSAEPRHRFAASWIRNLTTKPREGGFKNPFIVNVAFAHLPQNKKGTARINYKTGHIQVWINPDAIDSDNGKLGFEETVIHEMVHAVTKLAILQGKHLAGQHKEGVIGELNASQRRAWKNLNKLYEEYYAKYINNHTAQALLAKIEADPASLTKEEAQEALDYVYPGKNLEEFVVGIMTRDALRQRLKNFEYVTPDGRYTLWDRIIQIFDYLLYYMGLDKDSTPARAIKDILFLSEEGNANFATSDTLKIPIETYTEPVGKTSLTGSITSTAEPGPRKYTPDEIKTLEPNQIFVFGSNTQGRHGWGAALDAKQRFGAIQGQAEGLQGQSYAIITKDLTKPKKQQLKSVSPEEIAKGVERFIEFATKNPDKEFIVTKIGTKNAGYSEEVIANIFASFAEVLPNNVILPKSFDPRPDIIHAVDVQSNEQPKPPEEIKANEDLYDKTGKDRQQKTEEHQKENPPPPTEEGPGPGYIIIDGETYQDFSDDDFSDEDPTVQSGLPNITGGLGRLSIPVIPLKKPKDKRSKASRIPKVSIQTSRLLAERDFAISQYRKHEASLRADLRDFNQTRTKEDIKHLHKRLDKVIEKREAAEEEREKISKLTKIENLVAVGEADMKEITNQLANPGVLDMRDFHIIRKKLNLWLNYDVNFLDKADQKSLITTELFKNISYQAKRNDRTLVSLQEDMIYNWAQDFINRKIDKKTFLGAMKDIGPLASLTLGADNANHPLIQAVVQAVQISEADGQEEYFDIQLEIKKLFAAVAGKEHITGKKFKNFFEVDANDVFTGNLVRAYAAEFIAEKANLRAAISSAVTEKDRGSARFALDKFRQDNELFFDLRKLVKLEGFEEMHAADAGKLEAELKKVMGEIKYAEALTEAQRKYQEFISISENKLEEYEVKYAGDPEHIKNAYTKWLAYNSLLDYWDYMANPTAKKAKYASSTWGWKYASSVPKAVNTAGKSQYSAQYLKLQQDPAVAALHKYVLDLLKKLRSYVPADQQREFGVNSVPTIERDIIEMLKTEGIAVAIVSMMDRIQMGFTSKDRGEHLYGANVNDRSLDIKVKTLANDIERLYAQKVQDYQRSTGEVLDVKNPADQSKLLQFRKAASEEVQLESSLDLQHLLALYTQALVTYRHKAKIEDGVRLAEELFIGTVKERLENSAGEPVDRLMPDGQSEPEYVEPGQKNHLVMFKNYINTFFGVKKPIEGQTKQKLYTKKEGARLEDLRLELKKHQADLTSYEKELENLKSTTEGLDAEQAEARSAQIAEIDAKRAKTAAAVTDVTAEMAVLGQYITGTGAVNTLIQALIVKGLGWNVFGGLTNVFVGTMSNYVESAGGRWYNEKEMRQAMGIALNSTVRALTGSIYANQTTRKLNSVMARWDILKSVTKEHFRDNTPTDNFLGNAHWGQVYKTTEYLNQSTVLVAMMLHHKIKDLTGKESNLWEAFGKTGEWDTARFGDMNAPDSPFKARDRSFFKAKVDKVIRNNHGNYAKSLQIAWKERNVGKLLTVFRGWMFEGFRTRWEDESPDYVDDFQRKGRYLSYKGSSLGLGLAAIGTVVMPGLGTAAGFAIGTYMGNKFRDDSRFKEGFKNTSAFEELAWTTKYLIRKLSLGVAFSGVTLDERFNETDAINLRRNMAEISFLLYVTGAMMVMMAMIKGDDDDEEKRVLMYSLNVLHRLQQDLSFYSNPVTTMTIMQDPMPAIGLVEDAMNFIKHSAGYIVDPSSDEIPTGIHAGESKWHRSFMKLFPGTRAWQNFWNMGEQEIKDN